MGLNKAKGNMFDFVNLTFNPIKGYCGFECSFCYANRIYKRFHKDTQQPCLVSKELETKLGKDRTIFIGSSLDMFHPGINSQEISAVLDRCRHYPNNNYLFLTKKPERYEEFLSEFPENSILGTTIESNFCFSISQAPWTYQRFVAMRDLDWPIKFVSIEPIMYFSLENMVDWIYQIQPEFVSIGAVTGYKGLKEPKGWEIKALIGALKTITKVYVKDNLKRLIGENND